MFPLEGSVPLLSSTCPFEPAATVMVWVVCDPSVVLNESPVPADMYAPIELPSVATPGPAMFTRICPAILPVPAAVQVTVAFWSAGNAVEHT